MVRAAVRFALVLGVFVAACARYTGVGTDLIGPGYVTGGGEWNTGGGLTAVARVFERGGATVVCGAWTTDRQSVLSYTYNEDVMQAASVYVGGTRLAHNLDFMARVAYSDDITGSWAGCAASPVPWRAEFAEQAPRLRFPRIVFALNGGDAPPSGSGDAVVFREAARPAIVH